MITLGWAVTLLGVVLFPLPGPGLLLMVVGMAMLAEQYTWAERRMDALKRRAVLEAARGVVTTPKAITSMVVALALTASGGLWLWKPDQPSWWDLPAWTWLPGGFWAGISQALSGAVTVALVAYAWRRYHHRPDLVAALAAQADAEDEEAESEPVG